MAKADEKPGKKEEGEETSEAPVAAQGSKKKLFIIIGAAAAVVLVVVIVLAVVLTGGKEEKKDQVVEVAQQEETAAEGDEAADEMEENEEAIGAIFPLENFIVNLKGGNFLRVQVQLEFAEREVTPRFFARQVIIRDGLVTLLTSKTSEDVASAEGKDKLRSEIKDLINEVLKKQEVRRVYFTQFVVQ